MKKRGCFKMPTGTTITGRSSSIRNVFVAAIVPLRKPSEVEIDAVLQIFQQDRDDLRCSYCGETASEWDHLRPLVEKGRPTGFPSSIRNLVPSCGKCNQSKGKSDWKTWMLGKAAWSPSARGIPGIEQKICRLEQFEAWAQCSPIVIENHVDAKLLTDYYSIQDNILEEMRKAQSLAKLIASQLLESIERSSKSASA